MPNYTVECDTCGQVRDVFRSLDQFGKWPRCPGHGRMRQIIQAPQIVKDIEPYRAIAADITTGKAPVIGSRREHKEFLRRNGFVEVGNDKPKMRQPDYDTASGHDVKQAIAQVRAKR